MKLSINKTMLSSMLVLLTVLVLIGCSDDGSKPIVNPPIEETDDTDYGDISKPIVTIVEPDPGDSPDATLVPNSKNINELALNNPLVITFVESKATISGGTNASATATGSDVAVTLAGSNANIVLQGVSSVGSVSISGNYDCNLYLNGVGITSTKTATVINNGSGTMSVNIVDGTTNRLIDNAASSDKSTLYSEGDLIMLGNGVLEVRSNAGHAIASDGEYKQTAGNIWAKSAPKDGVNAKSITIDGGSFKARVIGDGLQGDDFLTVTGGALNIITTAQDQKANALKSDGNIEISGTPNITKIKAIVYGTASKCISSDGNLTITGGGFMLQTAGNGFWDESENADDKTSACAAIKCDGDLYIADGTFSILSAGSGGKGFSADGNITIDGGTFKVATTGDIYTYSDYDTSPKAIKSDNNLTINGGHFIIKTLNNGGEGLEAEYTVTINGGDFEIETYDDAINASGGPSSDKGNITINGGKIYCTSTNNDGIDCNGTIKITGGLVVAVSCGTWQEGFDCDWHNFTITGGIVLGLGEESSRPTTATSTICDVTCILPYPADIYRIENTESGENVMTIKLPKILSGLLHSEMCILFSSSKLVSGANYTLYSGGSIAGGTNFHGLYTDKDAEYTKGSVVETFVASKGVAIDKNP